MNHFNFEVKEISATGYFEGWLATYNNVDQGKDVILDTAFKKTLLERGTSFVLLWQHKADIPIGGLEVENRPEGLWAKGQLLMELPEAQRAYLLLKSRIVKSLSIGFEAIKKTVRDGVRYLEEIKLYEGSLVTFPMNELAQIMMVKSRENKDDFNEELAEQQLNDAACQMRCALNCALESINWDQSFTREQRLAAAEETIQQFSTAYMAYLPMWLDMMAEYYPTMKSRAEMEAKAGRMISAANRTTLQSAVDALLALLNVEAGTTTSETEAAVEKSAPVIDHSAMLETIQYTKERLTWQN